MENRLKRNTVKGEEDRIKESLSNQRNMWQSAVENEYLDKKNREITRREKAENLLDKLD